MRVFLDENMPRALRHMVERHEVSSVEDKSWKGKENGELLLLVAQDFDVVLTADTSIAQQNVLAGRDISVVVLPTNRWTLLAANLSAIQDTLDEVTRHSYRVLILISWDGRRTLKRLDQRDAEDIQLAPVPPFSGLSQ